MNETGPDEELVWRILRGDSQAADALYLRHSARVYAIVRRLAGDDDDAAEWAQDAWLRAFRSLSSFRGEARFATWLHRIAVNAAIQARRAKDRHRSRILPLDPEREAVGRNDAPDVRVALERAVDRLPARMRRVLVLHDIEGYTHEEIGEMLGVAPGTCKSQLFKARAKLREMLDPGRMEVEKVCIT